MLTSSRSELQWRHDDVLVTGAHPALDLAASIEQLLGDARVVDEHSEV